MASKTATKPRGKKKPQEKPLHVHTSYEWLTNLTNCSMHSEHTAHFEMKSTKRKMCIICVSEWEDFKNK